MGDTKKIYDQVSEHADIGSYNEFNKAMSDPVRRQKFYNGISKLVDLGSWDKFNSYMGGQNQSVLNPSAQSKPVDNKTTQATTGNQLYFGGQLPPVTVTENKEPVGNHFTDDEIKLLVGNKQAPSIFDKDSQEVQQEQRLSGISNALEQGMLRGKGTSIVNPLGALLSSIDRAVQTGQEGQKNFQQGDISAGLINTSLGATEIPFHLGMMMTPGGESFLAGGEIANQSLPENISKWQAPITAATNPQTETVKALAHGGDMVLQLALAHYIGKGVNVLKGNPLLVHSKLNYLNNERRNELLEPNSGTMDTNTKPQESNIIEGGGSVGSNTQMDEFSREKNKKGFKENQNQKNYNKDQDQIIKNIFQKKINATELNPNLRKIVSQKHNFDELKKRKRIPLKQESSNKQKENPLLDQDPRNKPNEEVYQPKAMTELQILNSDQKSDDKRPFNKKIFHEPVKTTSGNIPITNQETREKQADKKLMINQFLRNQNLLSELNKKELPGPQKNEGDFTLLNDTQYEKYPIRKKNNNIANDTKLIEMPTKKLNYNNLKLNNYVNESKSSYYLLPKTKKNQNLSTLDEIEYSTTIKFNKNTSNWELKNRNGNIVFKTKNERYAKKIYNKIKAEESELQKAKSKVIEQYNKLNVNIPSKIVEHLPNIPNPSYVKINLRQYEKFRILRGYLNEFVQQKPYEDYATFIKRAFKEKPELKMYFKTLSKEIDKAFKKGKTSNLYKYRRTNIQQNKEVETVPSTERIAEPFSWKNISSRAKADTKKSIINKDLDLNSHVDDTSLNEHNILGSDYANNQLKNYLEWRGKMINNFGFQIKPYLFDFWKKINQNYRSLFNEAKESSRQVEKSYITPEKKISALNNSRLNNFKDSILPKDTITKKLYLNMSELINKNRISERICRIPSKKNHWVENKPYLEI